MAQCLTDGVDCLTTYTFEYKAQFLTDGVDFQTTYTFAYKAQFLTDDVDCQTTYTFAYKAQFLIDALTVRRPRPLRIRLTQKQTRRFKLNSRFLR